MTDARPSPATLLLLAAWTIGAAMFFVSPLFPMETLARWQAASGGWLSVTLLASCSVGLVQLAILFGPGRQSPRALGLVPAKIPLALAVGLGLWALMQLGVLAAAYPTDTGLVPHPAWARGWGVALGPLLAQLLGTALMEEVVFRGFLWPEASRRLGGGRRGAVLGALVSQALFALMHVPIVLYGGADASALAGSLVSLFLAGLVFVLVYACTGNLFIAVVVHALGNAPTLLHAPGGTPPTLWLLAGCLGVCAGALAWRHRRGRLPGAAALAGA